METGSHFQQAAHPTVQFDLAAGWLGDPAENFKQRALARAVASDDADHLALPDVEREFAERPEGFLGGTLEGMAGAVQQRFRQRRLLLLFVRDGVRLRKPSHRHRDVFPR